MQDFGRYSVCGEIASGSTATVFLAEDKVLRRKVALKRLHPHLLGNLESVKRFRQEAVAIASLSHENIIQVYDYGDRDRDLYLAMEYVDGASLENLMESASRVLPNLATLTLLHQLMRGLAAAHGAGIVHRDIKPSNILVDRKGCVRIADFGIAYLAEENSITRTGSYLGTPVYSSPEQSNGLPASDRTDIFSSGIVFYRCLTGRLPFQGENPHAILKAILETQPRRPSLLNRRIFPGLSELTMAMLFKDPEKRPAAAACAAELEAIAARLGFALEPMRLQRFLAEPEPYPDVERQEIGAHFLDQARAAQEAGERRKAMKLRAQADLYSGAATVDEAEAGGGLGRLAASPRLRKTAILLASTLSVLAGIALLFAGATWHRSRSAARNFPPSPEAAVAGNRFPSPAPKVSGPAPEPAAPAAPTAVAAVAPTVASETPSAAPEPAAARPPRASSPRAASSPASSPPAEANRAAIPTTPAGAPTLVTETLPMESLPADGGLLVKSNPPFALVTVDGREAGLTPFKTPLKLAAGDHEITLAREGCRTHKSTIRVESGAVATVRLTLEKLDGASP